MHKVLAYLYLERTTKSDEFISMFGLNTDFLKSGTCIKCEIEILVNQIISNLSKNMVSSEKGKRLEILTIRLKLKNGIPQVIISTNPLILFRFKNEFKRLRFLSKISVEQFYQKNLYLKLLKMAEKTDSCFYKL